MEYIVKQGDNLWNIAQSQLGSGLAYKDILKANNLQEQDRIYPGQKLNIPNNLGESNKKLSTYTIKAGDSLSEIARDNNISLSELIKLNNISDPNKIRAGQVIQIPKSTLVKKKKLYISQEESDWNEKLINEKSNIDIINYYHLHKKDGQYYMIDDKMNDKIYLYKDGILIKSYNCTHATYAKDDDEVTTTKADSKGHIIPNAGNKKMPAGVFYMTRSTADLGTTYNAPAYIRTTPELFKIDPYKGIPNSIHAGPLDAYGSNGCTRMNKSDLFDLRNRIGDGRIKCYVLPAKSENKFFIRNGELQFHSSNIQKNPSYNTLVYTPITNITYDRTKLPEKANTEVINEFSKGLINYKKQIQEDFGINSDTYNKLAKAALGILGVESTFGKENNVIENIGHGVLKLISQKNPFHKFNTSSPDYKAKYEGITKIGGANKPINSIGLTQIRLSPTSIHQEVLDMISAYGITSKDLVYDPQKAAAATMLILAYNYKNMGLTVDKAVAAYNNKPSYLQEVKNYSKLFSINIKA